MKIFHIADIPHVLVIITNKDRFCVSSALKFEIAFLQQFVMQFLLEMQRVAGGVSIPEKRVTFFSVFSRKDIFSPHRGNFIFSFVVLLSSGLRNYSSSNGVLPMLPVAWRSKGGPKRAGLNPVAVEKFRIRGRFPRKPSRRARFYSVRWFTLTTPQFAALIIPATCFRSHEHFSHYGILLSRAVAV